MKFKVVSLFSGCGGLDLGFHENGFEIVTAVDNDPSAVKCFNYNFGGGAVCLDVQNSDFKELIKKIGKTDVVLGGFPCQGFSKSGPKKKDDPRNSLYLSMLYAVSELKPLVFLAENVDGLAQNYNGEYVNKIIKDFKNIGYNIEYRIVNAADYGVPQHRRRIIFIGHKFDNTFNWPEPSHYAIIRNGESKSDKLLTENLSLFMLSEKPVAYSVRSAISDLLLNSKEIEDQVIVDNISIKDVSIIKKIKEGQKLCNVRFSDTSVYTWDIPEVFGHITEHEKKILLVIAKNRRKKKYGSIPNGNPLHILEISKLLECNIDIEELYKLKKQGYLKEIDGKFDLKGAMFCSGLYKRPRWDEPSPTIITLFHNPRHFVHPSENRPFTVRECARLQSFPDSFSFTASGITVEDSYRLIGNAVPPRLASCFAKGVLSFLIKNHYEAQTTSKEYGSLAARVRHLDHTLS